MLVVILHMLKIIVDILLFYSKISSSSCFYAGSTMHKKRKFPVPPNSKQFIKNIGTENLRFLCIVEPAWKQEDDEILE